MRLNLENWPPYPQSIIYNILSTRFISFMDVFETKKYYLKFLLDLIRQTVIFLFNFTLLCLYQFVMPRL